MTATRLAIVCGLALAACASRRYPEAALLPKTELDLGGRPLSAAESRVAADRGFVILEDGEARSFHVGYTTIFHAHQPVYVTADSILYAWHSSYDSILLTLERGALIAEVDSLIDGLRANLAKASVDAQAQADLDVYLGVAASLAQGKPAAPVAGGGAAEIAEMTRLAELAAGAGSVTLFGSTARFDFSMLKPRGHYTSSPELERYFRAMSWLGRAELRIADKKPDQPWVIDRRALRSALLLSSLMTDDLLAKWQRVDAVLGSFVGPSDSMSVPALRAARTALRLSERPTRDEIDRLRDADVVSAFEAPSEQKIRTQMLAGGEKTIGLLLLGQRYVYDAQVLSDLTYGSLDTDPPRLMPTPLDVGAAVFRNASARALLAPEVRRYGAAYAKALDAASTRTDAKDPALWDGSLHHLWLGALRELSPDAERDAKLPAPLVSEAWGRRLLDAQLASWAELRHDEILYAKQSVTAMILCGYPHGYVDPYPAFYGAMEKLADKGLAIVAATPMLKAQAPRLTTYFAGLKHTMARLEQIARREQADQPLTDDDLDFFNHMVSIDGKSGGCGGPIVEASGWYSDLYFDHSKVLWHEPIIADVHTQTTDEAGNVVGRVLHVATGKPRMMVVTLQHDGGKSATTYRGFVSTYAEKITTGFARYTDEQWRAEIQSKPPEVVPWMRDIVAP